MSTDFQFTEDEDVLEQRQRQLDALRSPYQGRLTIQHVEAARKINAPEVVAIERAVEKVEIAERRLKNATEARNEVIRTALRHGWSLRAVAEIAGMSWKGVDAIKHKQ